MGGFDGVFISVGGMSVYVKSLEELRGLRSKLQFGQTAGTYKETCLQMLVCLNESSWAFKKYST